jgi:hypothetical protein
LGPITSSGIVIVPAEAAVELGTRTMVAEAVLVESAKLVAVSETVWTLLKVSGAL